MHVLKYNCLKHIFKSGKIVAIYSKNITQYQCKYAKENCWKK